MESFKDMLLKAKSALSNLKPYKQFHIVLGNESCDLDSTVSSLAYAFFLFSENSKVNSTSSIVIPVLNVSSDSFCIRTENCFLLKQCGVDVGQLVYRNEIDFEKLIGNRDVSIRTYLVDHHTLSPNDRSLYNSVCEIFDHRPLDENVTWSDRVKIRNELVGSCASIICDEIIQKDKSILFKEFGYLLYCTIVFDTLGVKPEKGKAKNLDIRMTTILRQLYDFTSDTQKLFEELWKVHNDVSHLTSLQLLYKDLKFVNHIPVPGLPMLVESYIKKADALEAINTFAKKHKADVVFFVGLTSENEKVMRDIGIFCTEAGRELKNRLINNLKRSEDLKGYNFELSEVDHKADGFVVFRQNNISLSRKQILPIIKETIK